MIFLKEKLMIFFHALSHNIEPFREVFQPPDFNFREYIDLFDEPDVANYTENDLTPKRYYISVKWHDDYMEDIKEPESY